MKVHKERKHVPYTPDQIFALVIDVPSYPEFLPWCTDTRVLSRESGEGKDVLTADLIVAFKAFRESFRSRVTSDPTTRQIDIDYIKGPFKYLHNRWRFENAPQGGCIIDFHIEFEFKSKVLQVLISSVFELAVKKMVKAFEDRAKDLYGAGGLHP